MPKPNDTYNWTAIENEYITTDISLREIGNKYGIPFTTIANRSRKHGWFERKVRHKNDVDTAVEAAGIKNQVERLKKIYRIADKLLDKAEECVDLLEGGNVVMARQVAGLLKDIDNITTQEDIEEQKARIERLRKDISGEAQAVTIKIESGGDYGC